MEIVTDIETVPAQRPDIVAEIREAKSKDLEAAIEAIKPPGNYKKQESIDEWYATEAPKARNALIQQFDADVDDAYRRTGLDGSYGQVCVVGLAIDDQPVQTFWRADWADEHGMLQELGIALCDLIPTSEAFTTTVIGHNVSAFDLRFLAQRHIVNGIRPHLVLSRAAAAKPWEADKVFDTMVQWAGVGNRIKLDKLCKALGIPSPKSDITGATVWDAVQAGRIADVAAYCARDVEATRAVYRRITFKPAPALQVEEAEA